MSELVIHAATVLINEQELERGETLLLATKNRISASLQGKVWEGLGRVYWVEKRWQDLEDAGRTMIRLDAGGQFGHRAVAIALAQQGKLDEAAETARQLVQAHPDDEYGTWLLANIKRMRTGTPSEPSPEVDR